MMHYDKERKYWIIELLCLMLNILRFAVIAGLVILLLILIII